MGLLLLLLHHHRRRPHLEGHDAGLHPAHRRRNGAVLPRTTPGRRRRHRPLHGAADTLEPRADELLLRLRDVLHGDRLPRAGAPHEAGRRRGAVGTGHGGGRGGRTARHSRQPAQPLPHLRVFQAHHARRFGAHPDGRRRRQGRNRQGHGGRRRRTQLRLHHAVELRRGRDAHPAHPRLQRRRHGSGHHRGEHLRRAPAAASPVHRTNPPDAGQRHAGPQPILGRPALHRRPRLCRRLSGDALPARPVCGARPAEVGARSRHARVAPLRLGPQRAGADALAHRPPAHVRQVPHRIVGPRRGGVHAAAPGRDGAGRSAAPPRPAADAPRPHRPGRESGADGGNMPRPVAGAKPRRQLPLGRGERDHGAPRHGLRRQLRRRLHRRRRRHAPRRARRLGGPLAARARGGLPRAGSGPALEATARLGGVRRISPDLPRRHVGHQPPLP